MSKMDFLLNLRAARSFFENRVESDHPAANADDLSGALNRADLWLTRSAVQGFQVEDFPELNAVDRSVLAASVHRFQEIAAQVPEDGPAAPELAREARPLLEKIIELTRPQLPPDESQKTVEKAVFDAHLPDIVRSYDYKIGEDSTGDAAIWMTLYVDDRAAEATDFFPAAQQIESRLRKSLEANHLTHWPYISFKTVREERGLLAESFNGAA